MDYTWLIFIFPIVLVGGFMIYQVSTKGLKGAAFGGEILNTYGGFDLTKRGILSGKIKVHAIGNKKEPLIGVEISHKTLLSYEMNALTFKRSDIQELIVVLKSALSEIEPDKE